MVQERPKVEFEGTLGNVFPKECLWDMEENLQGQEGENDEVSQHYAQMWKQQCWFTPFALYQMV